MGKCLSCCPATQSVVTENCDEKFTDVRHSEPLEQQPGLSRGDICQHSRLDENGRVEASTMANTSIETNSNKNLSITEKLILPILSTTCIDNKRSSHSKEFSESKVLAFFEQYKDPNENAILAEGIERLCDDLNVALDDFRILLLAWKLNAKQMFCFTKEEFVGGCRNLKADCITDIHARFPELIAEVRSSERFKDLYRFTFRFGLEGDQRVLMSEMAIQLWKLVFSINEPRILERWLRFLVKNPSVRGISRDTWNMFLNFADSVSDDLSSYDDTAAWPSLFDDFVEYENDQTNQNVVPSKEKSVLDT